MEYLYISHGANYFRSISSETGSNLDPGFWLLKTGKNTAEKLLKSFFDQKLHFTYP